MASYRNLPATTYKAEDGFPHSGEVLKVRYKPFIFIKDDKSSMVDGVEKLYCAIKSDSSQIRHKGDDEKLTF